MTKRIIFDVDDTIIPWTHKYFKGFRKHLKNNGIKIGLIRYYKLLLSLEKYDKTHTCWNKKEFLEYASELANIKLTDKAFKLVFDWLKECVIGQSSDEMKDTLEYLSKKYELVVLSNNFAEVQSHRLEKFGVLKYFKEVIGGDEIMKPHADAYKKAMGKHKASECIYVGDDYEYDVVGPSKVGIKPILISKKKREDCLVINDITELKNIL